MLGSRRVLQAISRRSFATSTTPENPRFKIASNLLKLQAIRAASDEASLKAAVEAKYVIDPSKLPADLKPLEGYLASAPPASGKFQYNSEFWQNKPFLEYVQIEAQRDYTWPFLVGAVMTVVILEFWLPSYFPEEAKKKSPYMQMKEGTFFDSEWIAEGNHHDHGHAHH